MLEGMDGKIRFLSEEELQASRRRWLASHPEGTDLWVFGYGSLIWHPAIHYVERRSARLDGFSRRFCLWTPVGRGSPECPGLVLGLMPGPVCEGIAYRIAGDQVDAESDILWRREMLGDGYQPCWVKLDTARGVVHALTFVINPGHERFAGDLSLEAVAQAVAHAEGALGSNRDYLFNTLKHLHDEGLRDPALEALAEQVEQLSSRDERP